MSKLEKQISKEVKIALDALEASGAVLWWERLNSGKVRTEYGGWLQLCKNGTSDFIALLPVEGGILPYFIETKSDKGRQTPAQLQFEEKVEACGCLYELIRDVKDMRVTIESVTNFQKNKLNSIDFS